jgi:trans-aconitate methyltransferase
LAVFQDEIEMIFSCAMSQTTSWNPENYAKNARFVAELGESLLGLLEPRPQEMILDLGCGDGALTEKITALGAVVYGVDASPAQIWACKKRGVRVLVMDGHWLGFQPCFNAVFTNAALHWMTQPEKVLAGVRHALKGGGRFVGEFGGQGNVDTIRSAIHRELRRCGVEPLAVDPWYTPSVTEYSELLTRAGFSIETIDLFPRPTKLPGALLDWLEIFAQPFIHAVPSTNRAAFIEKISKEVELTLRDSDGNWFVDYVRLRFKAMKQD